MRYRIYICLAIISLCLISCVQKEKEKLVEVVHETNQKNNTAIDALTKAIKSNPKNAQNYLKRGVALYEKGILIEAIKDLTRATKLDSSSTEAWHTLAEAYLEDNRPIPAIEALESHLSFFPKNKSSLLRMAEIQTVVENPIAAHIHLDRILSIDPEDADALYLKGYTFRHQGKDVEASSYFQKAVQSNPDLVDAYIHLGEIFSEAGNPLALKYFNNALRVDPENEEVFIAMANHYWFKDNYKEAHKILEKLFNLNPLNAKGHYNQGLMYMEQDSFVKAQSAFEHAVKNRPEIPQFYYYSGLCEEKLTNFEAARGFYNTALNLSPNYEAVKTRLADLVDK